MTLILAVTKGNYPQYIICINEIAPLPARRLVRPVSSANATRYWLELNSEDDALRDNHLNVAITLGQTDFGMIDRIWLPLQLCCKWK